MADRDTEWVTIEDVSCLRETPAALLCLIDEAEVWIPRSQVSEASEVQAEGDAGDLVIPEWLATEKELI